MKANLFLILVLLLTSCGEDEYIKSGINLSRIAAGCADKETHFAMESNINGERYNFNICLEDNYDAKNCSVTKSHDTVFVNFKKGLTADLVTYKATIDIDTYPRYNYIIIDGNAFVVVPAGN